MLNHSDNPADQQITNQKLEIVNHFLFPLLRYLFLKCDRVTMGVEKLDIEEVDRKIKYYFINYENNLKLKYCYSSNIPVSELSHPAVVSNVSHVHHNYRKMRLTATDKIVIESIKVFRVQLIELDKVNVLCQEFCNRYISCLKGKLKNEKLIDGGKENEQGKDKSVGKGGGNGTQ